MSAGNLPTTGVLSINDINVAFYGDPPSNNSLSAALNDAQTTKPAGINDLRGCPYCKLDPNPSSFGWANASATVNSTYLKMIPIERRFCLHSKPSWICYNSASSNTVEIYPQSICPTNSRSGTVCICDSSGIYQAAEISVNQSGQL